MLARRRALSSEGGLPDREALAALTRGPGIDMIKPEREAEAEEPDITRRDLERQRIAVRCGDVEGGAIQLLLLRCAADSVVVS